MKTSRVLAPAVGIAIMAGSGFAAAQAQVAAQTPPVPELVPLPPQPTVQRTIRIRNVSAGIIAWWVDAAHNAEPVQFKALRDPAQNPYRWPKAAGSATATTRSEAPTPTGIFALPTGVQRVIALDPQNVLLVTGTETGIAELQKTIAFLDRPLRQVEIEAQFVEVSAEEARVFGIDYGASLAGKIALGFVRGNFPSVLTGLVAQKRAKVLVAPRVTALNNFAAQVNTSQSRPAVMGYQDEAGKFHELFDPTAPGKSRLLVGTSFQFTVTPTINNDDTVTLLMSPRRFLQVSSEANRQTSELRDLGSLETIANVRDGETIALKGFDSRLLAGLEEGRKTSASNLLLFVTARIVRRGDDVQPVALRR